MKEKPLISFIVSCYNQETFIRAALEGALAQTYTPLEIIISDDCSSDRTFEIVQQMAAAYQGPHTLKLNRNSVNLGIGGNVNSAMRFCQGELILLADGDDVSLPNRTEVTFQAWDKFERKPTSVCLSYMTISKDGQELGLGGERGDSPDVCDGTLLEADLLEFCSTRKPAVCGCSHAWTPELFKLYGPLKSDLEDLVMSFRSLAISQILYVRQPLVRYRRHGNNVSFFAGGDDTISFAHRESRLRWVNEQTKRAYENIMDDLDTLHAKGRIDVTQRNRVKKEALRIRNVYAVELQMMRGTYLQKFKALAAAVAGGNFKTLRFVPRLLPPPIYRKLYLSYQRIRANGSSGGLKPSKPQISPSILLVELFWIATELPTGLFIT